MSGLYMSELQHQRLKEALGLFVNSGQHVLVQIESYFSQGSPDCNTMQWEYNAPALTPQLATTSLMWHFQLERCVVFHSHFLKSLMQMVVQFRTFSDDAFNRAMCAHRESYFSQGTADSNTMQKGDNGPALTPQLASINHMLDVQHQRRMASARRSLKSLEEATLAMVDAAPAA
jgi:hypothetical protein